MTEEIRAEIVKGECPTCRHIRNSFVRAKFYTSWKDPQHPIDGNDTYFILQCCGCETPFFRHDLYFPEDDDYDYDPKTGETVIVPTIRETYWPPKEKRSRPEWLLVVQYREGVLAGLLQRVYTALDSELSVLAAIGISTAFDRATSVFGIDAELSFARKLKALLEDGRIGNTEKEILDALIDAGNSAAHRGWSPKAHQLDMMMDVLEAFLHRHFVQRDRASELLAEAPKRGSLELTRFRGLLTAMAVQVSPWCFLSYSIGER